MAPSRSIEGVRPIRPGTSQVYIRPPPSRPFGSPFTLFLSVFWEEDGQSRRITVSAPLISFVGNEYRRILRVSRDSSSFAVGLVSGSNPPLADVRLFIFRSREGGYSYSLPSDPFGLDEGTLSALLCAPFSPFDINLG